MFPNTPAVLDTLDPEFVVWLPVVVPVPIPVMPPQELSNRQQAAAMMNVFFIVLLFFLIVVLQLYF